MTGREDGHQPATEGGQGQRGEAEAVSTRWALGMKKHGLEGAEDS